MDSGWREPEVCLARANGHNKPELAPMNGSEPRRGFLLCLAAILESPREMKSTLQSSELTAGRAIVA